MGGKDEAECSYAREIALRVLIRDTHLSRLGAMVTSPRLFRQELKYPPAAPRKRVKIPNSLFNMANIENTDFKTIDGLTLKGLIYPASGSGLGVILTPGVGLHVSYAHSTPQRD